MQDIIDQLEAELDKIDDQRFALLEQSERIRAALRALGAGEQEQPAPTKAPPAPVETRPKPSESRPKPGPVKVAEATCPDCGRTFNGAHGVLVHQKRSHKPAEPAPPAAVVVDQATGQVATPAPKVEVPKAKPGSSGKILACSECDATFLVVEAQAMSRHTITKHKRGPLMSERTPVAA